MTKVPNKCFRTWTKLSNPDTRFYNTCYTCDQWSHCKGKEDVGSTNYKFRASATIPEYLLKSMFERKETRKGKP